MAKYRVTLRATTTEIVEAENPYQAAVVASARHGDQVEIAHVAPAVGRPAGSRGGRKAKATKVVKKKRQLSPETRAKLAQNLAKARAARAAKRKAAKAAANKAAKKRAAKKR
jgi:hypothetical protein